jgi:DNA-binding NarL/FixJ family response regulator
VQSADPRIRCLLLTGFDDGRAVRAAVLAGAAGYVPKLIRDHDLANAIRRAAAGESLIAPERRAAALAGMSHEALATPLRAGLSPQERSVLDLMGQGMANREIAGELLIPEEAVSESVSAVLVKLGFDHRAPGAVLLARPPAVTG